MIARGRRRIPAPVRPPTASAGGLSSATRFGTGPVPLLTAALAILLAGCSTEPALCPVCPGESIAGRVSTPAGPVPARIVLHLLTADPESSRSVEVETDDAGFFAVELPPGDYLLALDWSSLSSGRFCLDCDPMLYYSHGRLTREAEAETLRLATGDVIPELSLALGSLEVAVTLGDAFEGTEAVLEARGEFHLKGSVTVEDGHAQVELPAIPPGDYLLKLEPLGTTPIWLPDAAEEGGAEVVTVGSETATSRTYSSADPPGRINGRIEGLFPGLEAELSFFDADSLPRGSVRPDAAGDFSFRCALPESLRIRCRIGRTERWLGGSTLREATAYEVGPGIDIDGLEIENSAVYLNFGFVDPGGPFRAILEETNGRPFAVMVDDSRSAQAVVRGVPPGEWLLRLEPLERLAQDWVPHWFDRALARVDAVPIVIPEDGSPARLEMLLPPGGEIRGQVTDPSGGAAEATLVVSPADDPSVKWTLDVKGPYAARGLEDGDYVVGAFWPGEPGNGVVFWYPGTEDRRDAARLAITGASMIEGIEIVLP